jgi:hypothetical protein
MNKEYIRKLVLETIMSNISSSKKDLIKESKDFGFSLEEILEEGKKHESGIVGHYLATMETMETIEIAFNIAIPEIKKTVSETPHEFANRVFPIWASIFKKKYEETAQMRSEKLKPVYDLIDGYLLEAIKYSLVESIAENNFNSVYDGRQCTFAPDEESLIKARENAANQDWFENIETSAFSVLRDSELYYQTRYTYIESEDAEIWSPSARMHATWGISPYRSFLEDNSDLLLNDGDYYFDELI